MRLIVLFGIIIYCALVFVWFAPTFWNIPLYQSKLLSIIFLVILLIVIGAAIIFHFRRQKSLNRKVIPPFPVLFRLLSVYIVITLAAFIYRVDFYLNSMGWINSDNSLGGLMAKHISEGAAPPAFLYGQLYLGSLTSHLAAILMYFLGSSVLVLKIVPFISFSIFVTVLYFIVFRLVGKSVAVGTAILSIVAPQHLFILSFDTSGGFMEILMLSVIALALIVKYERHSTNINSQNRPILLFFSGYCLGLAFWVNPMVISVILLVFLILFQGDDWRNFLKKISTLMTGILVGSFPLILSEFTYKFVQTRFFFLKNGSDTHSLGRIFNRLVNLFRDGYPAILLDNISIGFVGDILHYLLPIALPLYIIFIIIIERKHLYSWLKRFNAMQFNYEAIFLVHFILFVLVLISSGFGDLVNPPRYLTMSYLSLPVLIALPLKHRSSIVKSISVIIIVISIFVSVSTQYQITRASRISAGIWKNYINFLKKKEIHYANADYWVAYVTTFLSNESTICCVTNGKVCIPHYCEIVSNHIPAYIFHDNLLSDVRKARKMRVRQKEGKLSGYKRKRFGPLLIFYHN